MSKIKNGRLDQYGKVQGLNGIRGEKVKLNRSWREQSMHQPLPSLTTYLTTIITMTFDLKI